jgi:hypothetical protein
VQGAYVKGNGSAITGLVNEIQAGTGISISGSTGIVTITNNNPTAYANANVVSLMSSFGSNTITTTGNITGGNILTTGRVSATGNVTGGNVSATGNVTGGNVSATGNVTGGNVSATGTVSGSFLLGNASSATGVVNSVVAGPGISVSSATGIVTINNTQTNSSGKVAGSFTTGTTGYQTQIISKSVMIPANTFAANDTVRIRSQWVTNSDTNYQRIARIYVNTANSIPGDILQVYYGITAVTQNMYYDLQTTLNVISSTNNTRGIGGKGNGLVIDNNVVSSTGMGMADIAATPFTFTIDWTQNQYIIFTCQNASGSVTSGLTCVGYQIYKE